MWKISIKKRQSQDVVAVFSVLHLISYGPWFMGWCCLSVNTVKQWLHVYQCTFYILKLNLSQIVPKLQDFRRSLVIHDVSIVSPVSDSRWLCNLAQWLLISVMKMSGIFICKSNHYSAECLFLFKFILPVLIIYMQLQHLHFGALWDSRW